MFSSIRSIRNFKGFSLLELIVVIAITGILTTLVAVNFQRLRMNQEIRLTANNLVSKIREVQTFVLSGRMIGTVAPESYDVVLTANSQGYTIDYIVRTSPSTTSTTTLETNNLPQRVKINQVLVQSIPKSPVRLRFSSPYGVISVDGAVNQTVQINLNHLSTGETRAVIIDGISGRISTQ